MFVSVVGEGPEHVVMSDDGDVLSHPMTRREALDMMRAMWVVRAERHGLRLAFSDFTYVSDLNGYVIDGAEPDDWIEQVCGCYEDGGTVDKHVE